MMQTTNCYFYSNDVDVQLILDPTLKLRDRTVYQRNIKLYHGIDNVIRFTIKNNNQQRVNITGFNVTFNLISGSEGALILSKAATIVDAPFGIVTVTLNELELLDLKNQYYSYSLFVTDVDTGEQHIIYSDTDYDVRGQIILLDGHYPSFRPSVPVDLPAPVRLVITSDHSKLVTTTGVVKADSPTRQQSSHHTVQLYPAAFSGTVLVQATLDALPNPTSWADIGTITFLAQDTPTYFNWDGVFAGIRFIITTDPIDETIIPLPSSGSIRKILYRS